MKFSSGCINHQPNGFFGSPGWPISLYPLPQHRPSKSTITITFATTGNWYYYYYYYCYDYYYDYYCYCYYYYYYSYYYYYYYSYHAKVSRPFNIFQRAPYFTRFSEHHAKRRAANNVKSHAKKWYWTPCPRLRPRILHAFLNTTRSDAPQTP